ncbi:MAG: hypothetical protein AB1631_19790 [Acidobacteriota bacterium]
MEEERTFKLRWLELSPDLFCASVLAEAMNKTSIPSWKRRAVERLGIEIRDGETPSDAWLRAMCGENGIEFTEPVDRDLADVIRENVSCLRFFFALL